jgi:hypothetical protein
VLRQRRPEWCGCRFSFSGRLPKGDCALSRGCRSFVFLVEHVVVAWVVNLKTNPWCGFPLLGSCGCGVVELVGAHFPLVSDSGCALLELRDLTPELLILRRLLWTSLFGGVVESFCR